MDATIVPWLWASVNMRVQQQVFPLVDCEFSFQRPLRRCHFVPSVVRARRFGACLKACVVLDMMPSTAHRNEDLATQTPDSRQTAAGSRACSAWIFPSAPRSRDSGQVSHKSLSYCWESYQASHFRADAAIREPSNLVFTSGQYREILSSFPQRVPQIGNMDASNFGFVLLPVTINGVSLRGPRLR